MKRQQPVRSAESLSLMGEYEDFEEYQWLPDHDANVEREEFGNKIQYLVTMIGLQLGNSNLWKFPAIMRQYGGGIFLIKYLFCVLVFGIPMLYLELMIGQIAQAGPARAFGIYVPALQGLGWFICVASFFHAVNFNLLNAYSLYYTIDSAFDADTYRTKCDNDWNTPNCFSPDTNNEKCHTPEMNSLPDDSLVYWRGNCTEFGRIKHLIDYFVVPSEEYFIKTLYTETTITGSFHIRTWKTVLCTAACWCVAYFCLIRGLRFLGRLMLLVVSITILLNLVMFGRNLYQVRDSTIGITEFFKSDPEQILNLTSWVKAMSQCRRSLGLGTGGVISLASFNRRSNDSFKDALIISAVLSASCMIFTLGVFVAEGSIIDKFPQLTWKSMEFPEYRIYFTHYPEVLGRFAFESLWSTMFFFSLFCLGITSFFGRLDSPISGLTEMFTCCKNRRSLTIFVVCLMGMLLSLPLCTEVLIRSSAVVTFAWWSYAFTEISVTFHDDFSDDMGYKLFVSIDQTLILNYINWIVLVESVVILVYGPRNFYRDINASLARTVNLFGKCISPYGLLVRVCHVIIAPIYSCIMFVNIQYVFLFEYKLFEFTPEWQLLMGVFSCMFVGLIFIIGVILSLRTSKMMGQSWRSIFRPDLCHPSIRYKIPPPSGRLFSLNPIEVTRPKRPSMASSSTKANSSSCSAQRKF